jgi:hypothetical protein
LVVEPLIDGDNSELQWKSVRYKGNYVASAVEVFLFSAAWQHTFWEELVIGKENAGLDCATRKTSSSYPANSQKPGKKKALNFLTYLYKQTLHSNTYYLIP